MIDDDAIMLHINFHTNQASQQSVISSLGATIKAQQAASAPVLMKCQTTALVSSM